MRNTKRNSLAVVIMCALSTLLMSILVVSAQAQKAQNAVNAGSALTQQPLFTEYKGVRLGMTAEDVLTKLGKPTFMDKDLGYFVFSATETVQIGYDLTGKVKAISIDYQNGAGAPEPRAVVGADLETREDGSQYKVVYYDSQLFQVSYSRTAGPVIIVTITIQKMWSAART